MQLNFLQLVTAIAFTGISYALPAEDFGLLDAIDKRALTPDNTCGIVAAGNGKNYTCDPKLAQGGGCCSASGYCGSCPNPSSIHELTELTLT